MNVILNRNIKFKLNDRDQTSSVFKLMKATSNILIPSYIKNSNKKYNIISISKNSFSKFKIDSLSFPEDSAIISFDTNSFSKVNIKKLQIPASLRLLKDGWCDGMAGLVDIQVSPRNKFFSYIENKYLVGKSASNEFDTLYYARYDIKEAVIPPQIKVIKRNSFDRHENIKSIIFPETSKLQIIEFDAFCRTPISRLVLPSSVEVIDSGNFCSIRNLIEIEVMPSCSSFMSVDKKYLFKKSNAENEDFDVFMFCCRDVEEVEIPKNVKVIDRCAFQFCNNMRNIIFEKDSSLEIICDSAFSSCGNLKNIVIPASVKKIGQYSFSFNDNLQSVTFLGRRVEIGFVCFNDCRNLAVISFPKASFVILNDPQSMCGIPKGTKIELLYDAELVGPGFNLIKTQIVYIEHEYADDVIIEEEEEEIEANSKNSMDKKAEPESESSHPSNSKEMENEKIVIEEEEEENDFISSKDESKESESDKKSSTNSSKRSESEKSSEKSDKSSSNKEEKDSNSDYNLSGKDEESKGDAFD